MDDWYKILDVPENISDPELEALEAKARREHHPDRYVSAPQAEQDRHAAQLETWLKGVSFLLNNKTRELLNEYLRQQRGGKVTTHPATAKAEKIRKRNEEEAKQRGDADHLRAQFNSEPKAANSYSSGDTARRAPAQGYKPPITPRPPSPKAPTRPPWQTLIRPPSPGVNLYKLIYEGEPSASVGHPPGLIHEQSSAQARWGKWWIMATVLGALLLIIALIPSHARTNGTQVPLPPAEISANYLISVYYDQSLSSMISTAGLVPSEDESVGAESLTEARFPIVRGPTEVTAVLVRLTDFKWNDSDAPDAHETTNGLNAYYEAKESLRRLGLRPATLPELLAFSQQQPQTESGSSVVELGSISPKGQRDYLYCQAAEGYLEASPVSEGFYGGSEFLAVRG